MGQRLTVSGSGKRRSLLVFAGAAVGLVCGAYLVSQRSTAAAWSASLAGVACYLLATTVLSAKAAAKARPRWFRRARRFVVAVCFQILAALLLLILALASMRLAVAVRWDPQGEPSDGSMFGSTDCGVSDLAPVSNAKGDVAGARLAYCGWGPWAGMTYEYIVVAITRSRGTHKTREVFFRYEPATSEEKAVPTLRWLRDDVLSVTVGENGIEQISKQRFDVDGVKIRYSLGAAKKPPMTIWDRF